MSIVLVLVAVAVIAATLMVASGRGEAMADAPPDRSPEPLPDGPITPADVSNLRFGVGLRGYRMDQVDRVVDRLALELEWRNARIAELERVAAAGRAPEAADQRQTPRHLGEPGDGA